LKIIVLRMNNGPRSNQVCPLKNLFHSNFLFGAGSSLSSLYS
jgi:hypothetical protein